MKLLVSCIPWDGGKSGISAYIRGLVGELRRQGHDLTLLCEPDADIPEGAGLPVVRSPRWASSPALNMLWHLFALPRWVRRHRNDFDAVVLTAANRRVCASCPLPTVGVVHDLANFRIPGKYSRLRMFHLAHILPHYAKKAKHLVAVSAATAADAERFWHCRPGSVAVLHEGFPAPPPGWARDPGARQILYVSRLEHPGKNHVRLIEAYGLLPRDRAEAHPLVLAGADWKDSAAIRAAAAASPHADLIRFAGFVEPGAPMERLWAETGFYVFPSLFEGFGISLAEAMARGIPCACSGNGALAELAGDAAETFDPEDPADIAAALRRLLGEDSAAREARVRRGLDRAAAFSWPAHARGLVEQLRQSSVFGVRIDCDTNEEAMRFIRAGGGSVCAFVNAHCLNLAIGDGRYRNILNCVCDRVWPDGTGVGMAARKLGFVRPENVNGTDLLPRLAAAGGLSFWLLGARPGVAEEALRRAKAAYPDSTFLGATDGYRKDWTPAIAEIAAAKPDVLLVGLGVPLQEKWLSLHRNELREAGVGCMIAVGALIDFMSGRVARAPLWMRRRGCEWLWRLLREPCRLFRRYVIGNFLFLWRVRREDKRRARW